MNVLPMGKYSSRTKWVVSFGKGKSYGYFKDKFEALRYASVFCEENLSMKETDWSPIYER